jgi:hypothetical protein
MTPDEFVNVSFPLWGALAVLVAGLSAAGLAFLFGHHLLHRYWPSRSGPPALPRDLCILGGGSERRRWPRTWGNPVEVLVRDPLRVTASCGVVVNRSQGGVAILVDECPEPGSVLSLRPPEAEKDIPWVQVKVIHHRRAGRQWLVGCAFVEAPPWNVLVWLG